jgi:KaiC/GvpD/RAD55 family RecA-like ATPase
LYEILGGGFPQFSFNIIAGSPGCGKSLLATQFIMAGLKAGEPGIIAVFEERPEEYVGRALTFGLDLKASLDEGRLEVIYLRPLDLSVDEMMCATRMELSCAAAPSRPTIVPSAMTSTPLSAGDSRWARIKAR